MEVRQSEPSSLLSQELIGREPELAELSKSLQLASEGKPQLILVSGEAGLGKSRLCQALVESEPAQAFLVLFGQASPQAESWPFGPFLDAFRRYFLVRTDKAAQEAALPHLLHILPELQNRFPQLKPLPLPDNASLAQSQHVLFQTILNGLRALEQTANRPILLILEDLHWADSTSLELLSYMAHQLSLNLGEATTDRMVILGTYRNEEVSDSPALGRVLMQLNRQRLPKVINLTPLNLEDHARLITALTGRTVSAEFNALLYQRDEGNPFYAEELLNGLLAPQRVGDDWQQINSLTLPLSLKASIMERVATLPEADQETLAYAATIGREFDFDLLAALTGLGERELLAVLRKAINAHLIEEQTTPPGLNESEVFRFRHAITREAIYSEMLTRERRMRHREVAEKLVGLVSANSTKMLNRLIAEHFWLAGLPDRARPYALQEAEHARQLFAFREERHYLQMALPEDGAERLPLLHRLGLLSLALMDVPEGLKWLNLAKVGYQEAGQPRQEAAVLVHLTFLFWFFDTGRLPGLVEELEAAALATAQEAPNFQDSEALSIYSQTAFSMASADKHGKAKHWLERSFKLAEDWPDPTGLEAFQLSLMARGVMRSDGPAEEVAAGIADMEQVISFALSHNLPDQVMVGYSMLLSALITLGQHEKAEAVIHDLTDYETRTGSPPMSNLKGWQWFFSGKWNKAIAELREQLGRLHSPTAHALYRVALAHFLIARRELAEARQLLETALPQLEPLEFSYAAGALWGLAKLEASANQPELAEKIYDRVFQLWKGTEDSGIIVPILLDGISFLAEHGHLVKSNQWLTELEKLYQATHNPVTATSLAEAQAIQAQTEGALFQANSDLETALVGWTELNRPYRQALVAQRQARLVLEGQRPNREQAEKLLKLALENYERLELAAEMAEVKAMLESTRLQAQSKRRATLAAKREPFQGLTRREVQVLVQLCAGLTNKEIAAALSIAEGTVELHVNHILLKLNCESRVQAATYAIAQGWVKAPH